MAFKLISNKYFIIFETCYCGLQLTKYPKTPKKNERHIYRVTYSMQVLGQVHSQWHSLPIDTDKELSNGTWRRRAAFEIQKWNVKFLTTSQCQYGKGLPAKRFKSIYLRNYCFRSFFSQRFFVGIFLLWQKMNPINNNLIELKHLLL